ncbi:MULTISPECIES: dockerin type I domain-containing protein [Chitinophagaceae]
MKKIFTLLIVCLLGHYAIASSVFTGNWRWRNDDGGEATATWLKNLNDGSYTITQTDYTGGKVFRLRWAFYTNATGNASVNLQYTTDATAATNPAGASGWTNIQTGGTDFVATASSYVANGTATTQQITTDPAGYSNATYPFTGGSVVTNAAAATLGSNTSGNKKLEMEWAIKPSSLIKPGVTYYFRVNSPSMGTPPNANYIGQTQKVPYISTATDIIPPATYGPGGVVTSLAAWYRADKPGTINPGNYFTTSATGTYSWYDWSGANAVSEWAKTNSSLLLNAGDAQHNYNSFITGFSTSNYFEVQHTGIGLYSTDNYGDYIPYTMIASARATAASNGRIFGIDNDASYAATPGLNIYSNGSVNLYHWTDYPLTTSSLTVTANQSFACYTVPPSSGGTPSSAIAYGLNGKTSSYATSLMSRVRGNYLDIGYGAWGLPYAFPGSIQEVVFYKRQLQTVDLNKVQTYQAIKEGITLTTSSGTAGANYYAAAADGVAGTTVWTGDATYGYNIAGIGRDDKEMLYQKQSNSINTNTLGQPTIGLSAIAATNQANTGIFNNDASYLIWGDNNNTASTSAGVTSYSGTTTSGTAISGTRSARIWRVQATGFDQSVEVDFPNTGNFVTGGVTLTGCDQFVLIGTTNATADFSSNIKTAVLTLKSGSGTGAVYKTNFNFTGVNYFTVAKLSNFSSSGPVSLINTNGASTATSSYVTSCTVGDWTYYVDGSNNKLFAVKYPVGTTPIPASSISITSYSDGTGSAIVDNDGTGNFASLLPRIVTINNTTGAALSNLPVKFYYGATEYNNTATGTTNSWFVYNGPNGNNGTAANLQNDLSPSGVANTTVYTMATVPTGTEDGANYVSYNNTLSIGTGNTISLGFVSTKVVPNIGINVKAKVFLQGVYNGGSLSTALNTQGLIPHNGSSVYSGAPFSYTGTAVNAATIPSGAVDWVLVEVRSSNTVANTTLEQRIGFVKSDGTLIAADGTTGISFSNKITGNNYIVVRHRNHLGIIAATPTTFTANTDMVSPYDFTVANAAYGTGAQVVVASGVYAMWLGDVNQDGEVNALDIANVRTASLANPHGVYNLSDVDLTGEVNSLDYGKERSVSLSNPKSFVK